MAKSRTRCDDCAKKKKDRDTSSRKADEAALRFEANTKVAMAAGPAMDDLSKIAFLRDLLARWEFKYENMVRQLEEKMPLESLPQKPSLEAETTLPSLIDYQLVEDQQEWMEKRMGSLKSNHDWYTEDEDSRAYWFACYQFLKRVPAMEDRSHIPTWLEGELQETLELAEWLKQHRANLTQYMKELREAVLVLEGLLDRCRLD